MLMLPFKQTSAKAWRKAAVMGSMEGLDLLEKKAVCVMGQPGGIFVEEGVFLRLWSDWSDGIVGCRVVSALERRSLRLAHAARRT